MDVSLTPSDAAGETPRTPEECESMAHVRQEIDRLDRRLVEIIAVRSRYVARAGEIKPSRDLVYDAARIEDVVQKVLATADAAGLNPDIAERTWRAMIDAHIDHEYTVFDARRERSDQR